MNKSLRLACGKFSVCFLILLGPLLLNPGRIAAQTDSACVGYFNISFPNIGQKKVLPIAIGGSPGNPRYVSLLQYTPQGYNPSDFNKLYPVVIYFPGYGAAAEIDRTPFPPVGIDPCGMLDDQPTSLPGKIAERKFRDSAFHNGQWHKFVVLQFQYDNYVYFNGSFGFPSASSVDSVIDYALANYRVDPDRIYLTGMSAGANIVMEYIASSVGRARRVAAASISSTCSQVGFWPNSANAGANIATANLPVRFISCTSDGTCPHSTTVNWINNINANNPGVAPELIVLNGSSGTFACENFTHNSWNKLYDTAFRFNGRNLFEWYIQYSRAGVVPVKLENFSARLNNRKVYLNWTTSREINASSFTIEKSGSGQRYTELATIKATGNSNLKNEYSIIDDNPHAGINYYRLVQTDADNRKHYFEVRKVMNAGGNEVKVQVIPNPVKNDVTAFINLSKSQRVIITITNASGAVLKTRTAVYGQGNTGITMPLTDLPKGVYFMRVLGEDFSEVKKLFKQ